MEHINHGLVDMVIKYPQHNITVNIILLFTTCILCSVAIPWLSEIYTFLSLTRCHLFTARCCLMLNFKHNCIIIFTTNKLQRFSKSIMTECQKTTLKLLSSTSGNPAFLISILKSVITAMQVFSVTSCFE